MKTIEEQVEKQIKALEEHGKQLVKSSDEKGLQLIQNKKKLLKNLLIKEWKKYRIELNKLILTTYLIIMSVKMLKKNL